MKDNCRTEVCATFEAALSIVVKGELPWLIAYVSDQSVALSTRTPTKFFPLSLFSSNSHNSKRSFEINFVRLIARV